MGKIHCAICKRKCTGDVLKLDQKFIHKDCFICYDCSNALERGGFFHRDGHYYCTEDYLKRFGVKCGICANYVDGEVVTILGETFHILCFKCHSCNHSFRCGDKAILWSGQYFCDLCANSKLEQENVSLSTVDANLNIGSEIIVPSSARPSDRPIVSNTVINTPYTDSSDTEGPLKSKDYLRLRMENGYTSTDSGVEKTKSEYGYLSPCYSTSSGDESWMKSSKSKKSKTLNHFQFGKFLNQSYLTIERRMSQLMPINARYKGSFNSAGINSRSSHFHRQDNVCYRSQPNINSKKGMSLLVSPFSHIIANNKQQANGRCSVTPDQNNIHRSQIDHDLTEEVKRLSHYPDAQEPNYSSDPPIERYDFPAPPLSSLIIHDFKKKRSAKKNKTISSNGNIFVDSLSATDTALDSTDFQESEDERIRHQKTERRILSLKSTGKYCGLSQSILDEFENRTYGKEEPLMDPVSSSRSPDASFEPSYKTRYQKHTFTSPSRDSRYEGRTIHQLQSKMQYTSTGGRMGTMSGYTSNVENESLIRSTHSNRSSAYPAALPGYTQGYMSCNEGPVARQNTGNQIGRASSLPRPLNIYTPQISMTNTGRYPMESQLSTSMTTSGYSVNGTTQSMDESTLIGGSAIITAHALSDVGPSPHRVKPQWYYESDNEAVLHSNYPTVQSYLKQSNHLRPREKVPVPIIPYDMLKISNFALPEGVDRTKLEVYLSDTDFLEVFHMPRPAFSRLPAWKRNDLKHKVDMY